MDNSKMQNDSMPMKGNIQGLKMKPEMMQKHRTMYAELVQIQKEPDIKKRQDLMASHIQNMQGMLNDMQGLKITPEMMQRRQLMQDEMMKITNEPELQKRQTMLIQHMYKMQIGYDGKYGMMPMNEGDNRQNYSSDHNH